MADRQLPVARTEIGRPRALSILDDATVPSGTGLGARNWPVGAAMLQFSSWAPGGLSVREAGPEYWRSQLRRITREGFDLVELLSSWLPVGEVEPRERAALVDVLSELELGVCATSVVRKSIIADGSGDENLGASHRAIDAAADIGAPVVCLGLHEELLPPQTAVPWFWSVPGRAQAPDRDLWKTAVARFRQLGKHASEVGIDLSLETYEGTFLGESDSAVAFIHDIGRENVRLNPDLGNLIRPQQPIEPWEAMAVKLLPYANYWHVKNYARAENPATDTYMSTPCFLEMGLVDYRKAVRYAISHGFRGAFLCENYGGDGLAVSAHNARYLRHIIDDALTDSG